MSEIQVASPVAPASRRRRFLTGATAVAAGAAATVAMPNVSRAQTVTLKMQGAWGAKDIFNDMAQAYVARVNEMSGGRLVIEYLIAGAVVKPFSTAGRGQRRRARRRPSRHRLLVRQEQGGLPVRHQPGLGLERAPGDGLDPSGRRPGALRRADPAGAGARHRRLLRLADADPAARLVQERRPRAPTISRG